MVSCCLNVQCADRLCYDCAEGVLFAEKDFNLKEHPEIPGVSNLQVIKLMQSFTSKELVTERFAWRHYYWYAQYPASMAAAPKLVSLHWPLDLCSSKPHTLPWL